jgi:TrpR-related protein YerC/YecD
MKLSIITKEEREELVFRFCQVLTQIKTAEEAASFITDLLSKCEAEMLAKRIKAAELLLEGKSYEEISKKLKMSGGTIARVSEWLKTYGEGYRLMIKRIKKIPEIKVEKPRLSEIKRIYPQYYWPEILLKEIVYSASKRQKNKLRKILDQLEDKSQLYKDLSKLIRFNA